MIFSRNRWILDSPESPECGAWTSPSVPSCASSWDRSRL